MTSNISSVRGYLGSALSNKLGWQAVRWWILDSRVRFIWSRYVYSQIDWDRSRVAEVGEPKLKWFSPCVRTSGKLASACA